MFEAQKFILSPYSHRLENIKMSLRIAQFVYPHTRIEVLTSVLHRGQIHTAAMLSISQARLVVQVVRHSVCVLQDVVVVKHGS